MMLIIMTQRGTNQFMRMNSKKLKILMKMISSFWRSQKEKKKE
jgi:hypothetical protein